ncbi:MULTISPECIES: phosphatase PAP2 family protein [Actinosynnema]|uniref:phosphatase PAP2 family protein n=1 Tax=Actinosynnema TaxID=40566 RepID=UPI0020A3B125|nr:phosphatase PAP2 family protein [Actinosynnema pretiosum]MCP2093122.1 undecaprenyl-diphosphatase [Actinosynnema pretiosum]
MRTLFALGALLLGCSVLLGLLVRGAPAPGVDVALHDAALELGSGVVLPATVISLLLSPGLAAVALVSLAARAVIARDPLVARWAVLLAVCWMTVWARYGYRRIRPIDYPQWSYPSGHVTAVTAVAFTASVVCASLARRYLRLVVAGGALAVVLTALSRVVLEMHWFTDTVGAVLATTGAGLLCCAVLRLPPSPASAGPERGQTRRDRA